MNLLVFRKPVKVYRSDSCPAGMGGYSSDGFTWRWYIPEDLKFRASNNLLEHLGSIVTPWIDMLLGGLQKGDCFLSMTDSTTSEGWSKKSNFSELGEDPVQAEVRIEVCRDDAKRKSTLKSRTTANGSPASRTKSLMPCQETMTEQKATTETLHSNMPNPFHSHKPNPFYPD